MDSVWSRVAAAGCCLSLLTAACNALLDIDDIDFGDGAQGGNAGHGQTGGHAGTAGTGAQAGQAGQGGSGAIGGTAGAGGSGGAPCPEDCSNGVDDDANQLVDCEDPCCANWRCIPPLPNQWSGPVALYSGTDQSRTCPGSWPTLTIDGGEGSITAPPASCTDCSCGAAQNVSCTVTVSFWDNPACTGTADGTATPTPNACQPVPAYTLQHNAAQAGPETGTGGSCPATGGTPSVAPASFDTRWLLCEGATFGAGCTGVGEACAPLPGTPFAQTLCIYRSGNRTCDTLAPFTEKRTGYDGIVDTRDCTNCTCSAPQGATCSGGSIELYEPDTNTTCSGAIGSTLALNGVCDTSINWPASMIYRPGTSSGGSCTEGGGLPTGSATTDNLITLCCLP